MATVRFPAATTSCFSQEALCEGVSEARLIPGRSGPGRLPSGSIRPWTALLGEGGITLKLLGDLNNYLALQAFGPESLPQLQHVLESSRRGARLWEMAGPWHQRGPWASPWSPLEPPCELCRAAVSPAVASWCHCGNTDQIHGSGAFGSGREHFFLWQRETLRFAPTPERKHQSCRVANSLFLWLSPVPLILRYCCSLCA